MNWIKSYFDRRFGSSILTAEGSETEMLAYAFRVAMTLIGERKWRDEILKSLVGIYAGLPNPDYVSMYVRVGALIPVTLLFEIFILIPLLIQVPVLNLLG